MTIQQAAVTVTGFVSNDPVMAGNDTFHVLKFRMGSTRSRFNAAIRQWEEISTAWISVKAYRALADNAQRSLRRGDRIIAVGVLNTEEWSNEQGEMRSRLVLEATNIGHDLVFGTTQLCKAPRTGGQQQSLNAGESMRNGDVSINAAIDAAGANIMPSGADPYIPSRDEAPNPVDLPVPDDTVSSDEGTEESDTGTATNESTDGDYAKQGETTF